MTLEGGKLFPELEMSSDASWTLLGRHCGLKISPVVGDSPSLDIGGRGLAVTVRETQVALDWANVRRKL